MYHPISREFLAGLNDTENREARSTSNLPIAAFAIQQGLEENIENEVALSEIQTPEHF